MAARLKKQEQLSITPRDEAYWRDLARSLFDAMGSAGRLDELHGMLAKDCEYSAEVITSMADQVLGTWRSLCLGEERLRRLANGTWMVLAYRESRMALLAAVRSEVTRRMAA